MTQYQVRLLHPALGFLRDDDYFTTVFRPLNRVADLKPNGRYGTWVDFTTLTLLALVVLMGKSVPKEEREKIARLDLPEPALRDRLRNVIESQTPGFYACLHPTFGVYFAEDEPPAGAFHIDVGKLAAHIHKRIAQIPELVVSRWVRTDA